MSKISAVIITKNEEDKIKRCLDSIKWVDEIVIVDDCSTDNTVKICKDFGARVVVHKSDSNFDQQRNLGINNASSDWILQLDADEIVPDELKEEILKAINSTSKFAAYGYRRKNYFLGHFLICASDAYHIKLFLKANAKYIGSSVHETLKVDGLVGRLEASIEHYNYNSIFQFIERQNFYTEREAKVLFETKGVISKKEVGYNLRRKPLKLFQKIYFKKKGYKDGFYGLIWAALIALRHIMLYAKYWELVKDKYE
ncbi:MAG: glycosyltransferase family 2 protein [Candidatus Omnitrophota bacterium]